MMLIAGAAIAFLSGLGIGFAVGRVFPRQDKPQPYDPFWDSGPRL
jgi:hypothetical protein